MKDSDSTGGCSSKKSNGRTEGDSSSGSSFRSNGTTESKRSKKTKAMMGSSCSSGLKGSTSTTKKSPRKGSKQSPELRPRRRASQTYFFKYQLAKNPLKVEEDELKLALIASLQHCSKETTEVDQNDRSTTGKKGKSSKKNPVHLTNGSQKSGGRHVKDSSTALETPTKKKKDKLSTIKKGKQYKINTNTTKANNKRRGSVESSSSSIGSSFKGGEVKKTSKGGVSLLQSIKTEKQKKTVKNSLVSCNDLTSVQNKIKKAKRLLQNKQANKSKSNAIISKYSAIRKFPSNSSLSTNKTRNGALLSPIKGTDRHKSKSKLNEYHLNSLNTASLNNTSANNYFIPYSPYTPLQKREPPDEDYLKKYKPETEDFLTFICFRTTAPNYQNKPTNHTNYVEDTNHSNSSTGNGRIFDKLASSDPLNLKQCTSSSNKLPSINNSPITLDNYSPNNHRRPTRQSPRLASSNRKISENDSSNHTIGTSTTAYDTSITYEEDMKRASIALEDMAQEINSSDDIHNEVAQNSQDCISRSSSPFKNNKHLVKGLMTREFAGGFADEDTIFESISNHRI